MEEGGLFVPFTQGRERLQKQAKFLVMPTHSPAAMDKNVLCSYPATIIVPFKTRSLGGEEINARALEKRPQKGRHTKAKAADDSGKKAE